MVGWGRTPYHINRLPANSDACTVNGNVNPAGIFDDLGQSRRHLPALGDIGWERIDAAVPLSRQLLKFGRVACQGARRISFPGEA